MSSPGFQFDFCIIGGGFQGLVLAYHLSKKHKVAVIEKEPVLGGLLSGIKVGDSFIERYYHHIFPENREIQELIEELDLKNLLLWKEVSNGFYYNNRIYGLASPSDLLFFKPLTLVEKIQFSLLVLKIKKADPQKLDAVKAKDWIINNSSRSLYHKMFEPLIANKFGDENLEKVSAGWFVGRIKVRSTSKGAGEVLGYLQGGFQVLIDTLARKIRDNGSEIIHDSFLQLKSAGTLIDSLQCSQASYRARTYISTINPNILFKGIALAGDYREKLDQLEYHGAVCVLLGLKNKISENYWINIIDEETPFKAVIEHTNLQPPENYRTNLVYLASYHAYHSDIWSRSKTEILNDFISGLQHIFPSVRDEDITLRKIFLDKDSGLVSKQFLFKNILPLQTPYNNLYAAGMFNVYPERGLNLQLKLGNRLLSMLT